MLRGAVVVKAVAVAQHLIIPSSHHLKLIKKVRS